MLIFMYLFVFILCVYISDYICQFIFCRIKNYVFDFYSNFLEFELNCVCYISEGIEMFFIIKLNIFNYWVMFLNV